MFEIYFHDNRISGVMVNVDLSPDETNDYNISIGYRLTVSIMETKQRLVGLESG